ncbi:MAG: O-antigen ligase family protein [Solirubrobacterales bacterium]
MLVACGAAALAVVVEDRRARLTAMVVALAVAPVLVLGDVWNEPRVVSFRDSPAQIAAAVAIGIACLALLVAAFRRYREAFPIAVFAVLPIRVPVEIGGETANLLVPLYLVIAAGVLVCVLEERRSTNAGRPATSDERRAPWIRWLRLALAATVALYAIQAAYSDDVSNAIENIGFFLVPFAIMFVLLAEVDWSRALLRAVLVAVAVVGAVCAGVAVYQWLARDLFLNPELFDANQLHQYFRVNSLFYDPNILGCYLALAITALAACIAWGGDRRELGAAAAAALLALVGMVLSFSITSFAALLVGLGIIAVLRFRARGALAAAALGLAGLAALLIAGGTPTSDIQSDRSIDSGRSDLVEGGLDLADDNPLGGYGSGSFGAAFVEHIDEKARTAASHSEPITVAAEQGAVGLVVYVWLVASALLTLLGGRVGDSLARTAVGACFVAMLVHSLGYAGFVIDPATWALLGLGVALRARAGPPDASATISR